MRTSLTGHFRDQFPLTEQTVFFNCGAKSPLPLGAYRRLQQFYQENLIDAVLPRIQILEEHYLHLKTHLAQLIHAQPDEIAIIPNTSVGINIALNGIDLQPTDTVVLPKNDFPCNIYPWLEHARRHEFEIQFAGTFQHCTTDDILNAITPQTRVVSVSFVDYATGYCMDVARIGAECHRRNILFVVDGIQGIGVKELNVRAAQIDLLTCGGPKWLLTPFGIGFAYIRREAFSQIHPQFVGWLAYDWGDFTDFRSLDRQLRPDASRYEVGTLPHTAITAFETILHDYFLPLGVPHIEAYLSDYTHELISLLESYGFRYAGPRAAHERSQILRVAAPGDTTAIYHQFRDHQVDISLRDGHLRFSPHFFNNGDDLDRLESVLTQLKF